MRQKTTRLEMLTLDRPSLCWAGISLSHRSLWGQLRDLLNCLERRQQVD